MAGKDGKGFEQAKAVNTAEFGGMGRFTSVYDADPYRTF
jgi:hypothetical protein